MLFNHVLVRTRRVLMLFNDVPVRTKRVLMLFSNVVVRTRRALSPQALYSNNALLVLNSTCTSVNCVNALLALN